MGIAFYIESEDFLALQQLPENKKQQWWVMSLIVTFGPYYLQPLKNYKKSSKAYKSEVLSL